jgi:acyl carrier protein
MGEDVSVSSSVDNLSGWDSLGHLSILSALDDATDGKIAEIHDFTNVKSVGEIVELFKKHNLTLR